jgi:hypothetical protein
MAGIPELERSFREAGGVDVDKADVDRFRAFVDEKVDEIAIAGRDAARWNNRDEIAPQDLPITKGLQERMLSSASSTRRTTSARRCAAACADRRTR